jgi:hypothetical protein
VSASEYEPLTVPLKLVLFGDHDVELEEDLIEAVNRADLVIALGDIDITRLAQMIGPQKPALCVLGDRDQRKPPPAPFQPLHGNGVVFRGWRIVGLCGGVSGRSQGNGFTLTEEQAEAALLTAPPADILLSHAPPSGLAQEIGADPGLGPLADYDLAYRPLYHFHANSLGESSAVLEEETLVVGVHGALVPPELDLGGDDDLGV